MKILPVNEGLALSFFRHLRLFKAVARKNYPTWQDDGEAQAYYVCDEAGNTYLMMTGPTDYSFDSYWVSELDRTYRNWTASCLGKLRRDGVERYTTN
jgi:hypothetical protein